MFGLLLPTPVFDLLLEWSYNLHNTHIGFPFIISLQNVVCALNYMWFIFSILENWTCCQIHQGMEFDLKGLNKISTEYAKAKKLAIEGTFLYASTSHLDYKNSVIKVQIYFIYFWIIPNFIKDHWSIEKKKNLHTTKCCSFS